MSRCALLLLAAAAGAVHILVVGAIEGLGVSPLTAALTATIYKIRPVCRDFYIASRD